MNHIAFYYLSNATYFQKMRQSNKVVQTGKKSVIKLVILKCMFNNKVALTESLKTNRFKTKVCCNGKI